MIKKIIYLLIFLNISLFSCAFIDDEYQSYNFLEKKDNIFLNYTANLNSAEIYNDIIYHYDIKNKDENLKEWQKALNNQYSITQIEDFLYKKNNLDKLKDKEILKYFQFAQEQESCVTYNYFEDRPKDCEKYIPIALNSIENTQNSFLKLRYFYLALRLAHYHKENPIQIYEKYSHLLENSNSIVKSWIEALYAGALIKSGKKVEGVYAFSKLFDNHINYHLAFYNFFHIKSEEEFNALLNLAKNNDEKTKIYMLRALNSKSNVILEMKNIYNIDKNSKWLDFLLYKELLVSFLNLDFEENHIDNSIFLKKYIEFLKSLKKDNNYLVDLSLVYFYIYTKDYEASKTILQSLQKSYPNKKELDIASHILYLNTLSKIDTNIENIIFENLTKLSFESSIYKYSLNILQNLYKKQGFLFDEFLVSNSLYLNYSSFDLEKIRRFDEFLNDNSKSKLKEHFKAEFKKYLNQKNYENKDYSFTKLTVLVDNLLFQEALDTNFEALNKNIDFNPFNALIKGNNRVKSKNSLTLKEFLQNALAIENKLKKEPNDAMENFLYANMLYNLSYFGNSSSLATVYKSSYSFGDVNRQENKLNLAIKHYEIALNNSNDLEFKAKVSYQIAKTNLALFDLKYDKYPQTSSKYDYVDKNQKFLYGLNDEFYEDFLKQTGAKYFDLIKKDYENTKYYKEIIKECSDFKTYINSKK